MVCAFITPHPDPGLMKMSGKSPPGIAAPQCGNYDDKSEAGRTGVRRSQEGYSSARQVLGVMKDHQRYGFKLIQFLFSIF